MIEDDALERLIREARAETPGQPRMMTDAEHRRALGWAWDDPDEYDPALWGPTEAM